VTVQLTKAATNLLRRLSGGATLIEVRGKWSSWLIEEPAGSKPRKAVMSPSVIELRDAGFIVKIDHDRNDAYYDFWDYTVTDAGRAYVAEINAPQEST
jgi:hypothetical protein